MGYRGNEYDNSSGIAYAWLVLSLFLIIAGILYAVFVGVVDNLITGPNNDNAVGINHDIAAGKQSEQSRGAIQFNVSMLTNVPFFVIMGAFVFAIARAIVVKQVP
jgi:hypothetical protein